MKNFPISEAVLLLQEALLVLRSDWKAAFALVKSIDTSSTACSQQVRDAVEALMVRFEGAKSSDESSASSKFGGSSCGTVQEAAATVFSSSSDSASPSGFLVAGQGLPAGQHARKGISESVSFLSGAPFTGPEYVLEDGESRISLSEAMMFAECCVFSPLCSGFRLAPF